VALAAAFMTVAPASAQPLGTFKWQLLPYCNVLTLTVIQMGGIYTLSGTDDQCGAPTPKASVSGLAFLNPSGSIGMGVTIVTPTTAAPVPVHLDISVAPQSLSGTWRDSAGNSGDYFFTSSRVPGGSPRPVSVSGLAPASVTMTQLAPGSVGPGQLAPASVTAAAIADGSITAAKIADRPRAAFTAPPTLVELDPTPVVVLSLTLNAPSNGRVVLNAAGMFYFTDSLAPDGAACAISTDATLNYLERVEGRERSDDALRYLPFSLTRVREVTPGPVTFNLVCVEYAGATVIEGPSMTAQFFPIP
jgi:hypothetical protein